jgi:hypothetical protein
MTEVRFHPSLRRLGRANAFGECPRRIFSFLRLTGYGCHVVEDREGFSSSPEVVLGEWPEAIIRGSFLGPTNKCIFLKGVYTGWVKGS